MKEIKSNKKEKSQGQKERMQVVEYSQRWLKVQIVLMINVKKENILHSSGTLRVKKNTVVAPWLDPLKHSNQTLHKTQKLYYNK